MNDWKELDKVDLSKPDENQRFWEEMAITAGIGAATGSLINFLIAPFIIPFILRGWSQLQERQMIVDRWWESGTTLFLVLVTYPLIYIVAETWRLPSWAGIILGALLGSGTVALMYLINPQENVIAHDYVLQAILCAGAGYIFVYMRKESQGTIG